MISAAGFPSAAPDLALGEAFKLILQKAPEWRHRKVESLRLMEGEFGRRRVSMDLTPPTHSVVKSFEGREDVILLPLALIAKRPMKSFDATYDDGRALPILTAGENSFVSWCVLLFLLNRDLGGLTARTETAAWKIVQGSPGAAHDLAQSLVSGGVYDSKRILDASRLRTETQTWCLDLAENFLLIGQLPKTAAESRQIVKYSTHWLVSSLHLKFSPPDQLAVGLGLAAAPVELHIPGAADAESYHLEVQGTPGLLTAGLRMPDEALHTRDDQTVDVVAHAVGSYASSPTSPATLLLLVPRGGLRNTALLTSLFTMLVFVLNRVLPDAHATLLKASDGAAALLLIIPAAFSLALSRPSDNSLLTKLLLPLRLMTLFCIALLLAGAASLVGHLIEPFATILWWFGALTSTVLFLVQLHAWRLAARPSNEFVSDWG